MIAVRDHLDRFGDATIAVVTFADPEMLGAYRDHLELPFVVLSDTSRALYQLLGVGRASLRRVWSAGTVATYARLVARGRRLRWPTQDVRQLGADAIVGRDGRLRFIARPETPDRRPSIEELVAALD